MALGATDPRHPTRYRPWPPSEACRWRPAGDQGPTLGEHHQTAVGKRKAQSETLAELHRGKEILKGQPWPVCQRRDRGDGTGRQAEDGQRWEEGDANKPDEGWRDWHRRQAEGLEAGGGDSEDEGKDYGI